MASDMNGHWGFGFRQMIASAVALGLSLGACGSPSEESRGAHSSQAITLPTMFIRGSFSCNKPDGPRGYFRTFESVSTPVIRLAANSAPAVVSSLSSTFAPDIALDLDPATGARILSVTQVAVDSKSEQLIRSRAESDTHWVLSTSDHESIPAGTRFSVLYEARDSGSAAAPPAPYPTSNDFAPAPTTQIAGTITGPEGDEPAQAESPTDGLRHVASVLNIIGNETCIDDFKAPADPASLFHVTSAKGKASARYVPGRKFPWCITFDDEGVTVTAGDVFWAKIYDRAPELCKKSENP